MITHRIDTSPENLDRLIAENSFQSADELAKHLGVHHTTIYRWLMGTQRVPVVVIRYLQLKAKTK